MPLITRERNFLLSNLHREIHGRNPRADKVWEAIVNVLRYPSLRPLLPPVYHETYDKSTTLDDHPNGEEMPDTRRAIPLSLPEIRKSFSILSSLRPPTRAGLSRLVVLVELLAMRSSIVLPEAPGGDFFERDQGIGELRGGGVGLRERDWHALMLFSARCYRAPRVDPDVNSAISLFTQWTKSQTTPSGRPLRPSISIYNTLMKLAVQARSWGLYEAIEERMKDENLPGDAYSLRIRLGKEDRRGENIVMVFRTFVEGVRRLGGGDGGGLWNEMMWIYTTRGMLEEAAMMYNAMATPTALTDLATLSPHIDNNEDDIPRFPSLLVLPPPRDLPTYSSLIQGYAHQGNLHGALLVMRDLIQSGEEPTMQMFSSLFRGFARYGVGRDGEMGIDIVRLSGMSVGTNAGARGSVGGELERRTGTALERTEEEESPWTYPTLVTLTNSFLALSPPPPPISHARKLDRTAPSSKQLFWLLLATESLSSGDLVAVLSLWEKIESKFGTGEEGEGWTGWKVDRRIRRRVEGMRERSRVMEEGL